ncbi:MAG: response regulator [Pseudomonadota bacterium]
MDDEPVVAKLYGQALANAGYIVRHASDGAEGVDLARQEAFDLILTDMNMPRKTGAEMAETLVGRSLKSAPILLLSASDSGSGLVSAVASGCDDFMQKGDSFRSIVDRVSFWLEAPYASLPADARQIFIQRTPEVADEITTLRRLSRNRWELEERATQALLDQLMTIPNAMLKSAAGQRRLVGVLSGILDVLGRSDPLSYLRRGDLLLACITACVPNIVENVKAELAEFETLVEDDIYLDGKQSLSMTL